MGIASNPSDGRVDQLDALARQIGIPASLLGATGLAWLLFSRGKQIQENMEAWGKLLSGSKRSTSSNDLPPSSTAAKAGGGRRFAVGFSYAGEDRQSVAVLAEQLAQRLGRERVLFDRFHEAELARIDLDVYLPRLYRDKVDLIVVVLSSNYAQKRWCGLEWRWIRQLILTSAQERIMLLQLRDPGDLSELGIVSGDGFLDAAGRPAQETSDRILERMAQEGIPIQGATDPGADSGGVAQPPPLPPRPWWAPSRRAGVALLAGAVVALPLVWILGRPQLARWQLQRGDQAFLAYAKVLDEARLKEAGAAWQQAKRLNPGLAAAHARIGFLNDYIGQPERAEAAWKQAIGLERPGTPQAKAYRNGLANVLAQEPARRKEALEIYDSDNNYPRSAIEAAMQRWPPARRAAPRPRCHQPTRTGREPGRQGERSGAALGLQGAGGRTDPVRNKRRAALPSGQRAGHHGPPGRRTAPAVTPQRGRLPGQPEQRKGAALQPAGAGPQPQPQGGRDSPLAGLPNPELMASTDGEPDADSVKLGRWQAQPCWRTSWARKFPE